MRTCVLQNIQVLVCKCKLWLFVLLTILRTQIVFLKIDHDGNSKKTINLNGLADFVTGNRAESRLCG